MNTKTILIQEKNKVEKKKNWITAEVNITNQVTSKMWELFFQEPLF